MDLNSMKLEELKTYFINKGEKAFRAKQVYNFFHKNERFDIENATVFSEALKAQLVSEDIARAEIVKVLTSKDNSKKFLIEFKDGSIVESVFMPYEDRNTICISSQVGCKMGCSFCASTKARFVRNLNASEILLQVYLIEQSLNEKIDNIVLMGIGEALDNYENLKRFIDIICSEEGRNLSNRSITLSTVGRADGIKRLADDGYRINLAISLHYPFDRERDLYMPINKKFKIHDIIEAGKYYFEKTSRRVSLEYVVIKNLNDSEKHILKLAELAKCGGFHINLIPLNEINEFKYKSANFENIDRIRNKLTKLGVNATIRKKRGSDIDAACGQLRIDYGGKI